MPILDQMNVKANESDTQGTDYDIRDRKLTTATSQSGVNTSDVVLLKDTSGNYHEITKDSFMGAVRSALGSLIKNYDKGTNVNGIAVTGSTGTVNDLGFSSPSDLASVLGGLKDYGVFSNADRKTLINKNGIYYTTQNVENMPNDDGYYFLIVNRFVSTETSRPYVTHTAIRSNTGEIFVDVCDYGTWRGWKRQTYNLPDFYKNYADLASLSTALCVNGLINASAGLDANSNDLPNGLSVYFITGGTSTNNMPAITGTSSAFFINFKQNSNYRFQIYVNIVDSDMYIRTSNNSGQYWGWKQVSVT